MLSFDSDARWAELADRQAVGETLTDEEQRFLEEHPRGNPACEAELAFFREMAGALPETSRRGQLDGGDEDSEQVLQKALAQYDPGAPRSDAAPGRPPLRRVGRWAFAAGALAAAAALLLYLRVERPSPPEAPVSLQAPLDARLVYAVGDVLVDGSPATTGAEPLEDGARVETGNGTACIALDPGIDVCLGERSTARIRRTRSPHRHVMLEAGRLAVALEPQKPDERFAIRAAHVWVTAVGTSFSVMLEPGGGAVEAAVFSGKVTVGSDAPSAGDLDEAARLVEAGQRARVEGDQTQVTSAGAFPPSPERVALNRAHWWRATPSAAVQVSTVPSGAELWLDEQRVGEAPAALRVPAGAHRIVAKRGNQSVSREIQVAAGGLATLALELSEPSASRPVEADPGARTGSAPPPRLRPSPRPEAAAPPTTVERLAEARRLMREKDWPGAARAYAALRREHPGSSEAHMVLVPLGRLELEQLRAPDRALRLLELYLQGGGPLEQEARSARIRALRELSLHEQEARAISEFLERYPNSLETQTLEQRLRELRAP